MLAMLAALAGAFASTAAAQRDGSPSAAGAGRCASYSEAAFERLGERAMDRMMGAQAHRVMDARMRSIMGAAGERRVHVFMGRRFSGCGGRLPGRFWPMMSGLGMGAMMDGAGGMMDGRGAYGGPGSMMYGRPGSMLGYYGSSPRSNDDDEGPSAAAMIGMMAVLIGAVALALLLVRPRRRGPKAIDLLDGRFARGELSAEEYQQSRRLLEGGASK